MEINIHKIIALTIIIGSILFLVAAFSPVSRIFGEPSPEKKLNIIMQSLNQWKVTQFLFAAGAIVTGIGIGLTGILFRNHSVTTTIYLSAALILLAAVFWVWHVYLRAVYPLAFTDRKIPVWLFAVYTLLTQAGLIVFGIALLSTGLPSCTGWLMIGSMVFFFLLTIIFKDMPPFVYYLMTLVIGVMIYKVNIEIDV